MWLCPTCISANDDANLRCIVCGRHLDQKEGTPQYCTKCGTKYIVNTHNKYCINCGKKLED